MTNSSTVDLTDYQRVSGEYRAPAYLHRDARHLEAVTHHDGVEATVHALDTYDAGGNVAGSTREMVRQRGGALEKSYTKKTPGGTQDIRLALGTDGSQRRLTWNRDAQGHLLSASQSTRQPDGTTHAMRVRYDADGNVAEKLETFVDAQGRRTVRRTDGQGREMSAGSAPANLAPRPAPSSEAAPAPSAGPPASPAAAAAPQAAPSPAFSAAPPQAPVVVSSRLAPPPAPHLPHPVPAQLAVPQPLE